MVHLGAAEVVQMFPSTRRLTGSREYLGVALEHQLLVERTAALRHRERAMVELPHEELAVLEGDDVGRCSSGSSKPGARN